MAKFHVLVEWPDPKEQPWLVLIEAFVTGYGASST